MRKNWKRARHTIAYLLNILKEKLPEIYAAVTQRNSPVADQLPEQKPKPKRNRDMERKKKPAGVATPCRFYR